MVTGRESTSADPLSKPKRLLRELSLRLGRVYDVSIPVPDNLEQLSAKDLKKFSSGLLEGFNHPWSRAISGLKPDSRMTIAGSLFLWRKTLPAEPVNVPDYIRRVTSAELPLPSGYLAHVRKIAEEVFPRGWDKGKYIKNVDAYTPTVNSVKENGRNKGGYRRTAPDRFEFGTRCTDPFYEGSPIDSELRFMVAECDGKDRAVTVMSSSAQVLGPLHKALYDHISDQDWLLRGEAGPRSFRDFTWRHGEVFVSGDYESASDHLPLSVATLLLEVAFKNSVHVPAYVKGSAISLLHGTLRVEGESYQVTRQLMGSLLCFPLLCLQNYTAFRYIFSKDVPVRVNGDDIVFRCTRDQYLRWASFVGTVGLKLSVGKTLVDHRRFSLNSTFFSARDYRLPRLIPVARCSTLAKSSDANSLAGSHRRFLLGSCGALRTELSSWFLREKRKVIQKSGRSVVRGLGIGTSDKALKCSGLWKRELYYLNCTPCFTPYIGVEKEASLPEAPSSKFRWVSIPDGWKRRETRTKVRSSEEDFLSALVENSWEKPPLVVNSNEAERAYWSELEVGGYESAWNRYRLDKDFRKKGKLFKGFKRRERLPSKKFYSLAPPRRTFYTWCRTEDVPQEEHGGGSTTVESDPDRPWFSVYSRLIERDDGWHVPVVAFPPPEDLTSFVIYDGW
jgi:hypothetical protein